ncbi:hypothetical protein uan_077 [Pseudomonas phage UAntarctica]|nr:hypothetical protein uan_077 [Pseudomonas phage UAntarctica]
MIDWKAVGLAVLIGILAGGAAAWFFRGVIADRDLLSLQKTYTDAWQVANKEARDKEQNMQASIDRLSVQGKEDALRIEDDSHAADASTDQLLETARVRFSAAACDPGVTRRSEAATRAALLYSELLEETQRMAKDLAVEADKRGAAGTICVRAAETMKGRM